MEYTIKANGLIQLMGRNTAIKFVDTKIAHWLDDKFEKIKSQTLDFWETVSSILKIVKYGKRRN